MKTSSPTPSRLKGLRVLVTSGPTSVPMDDVRVITNRSTGEMGRIMASACVKQGARVTLLEGNVTTRCALPAGVRRTPFFFLAELDALLAQELKRGYDVVIHAAAVSDFVVKNPWKGKVSSSGKKTLQLVPAKKLVNTIRASAPKVLLVGFKLETSLDKGFIRKKTTSLFKDAGCDFVVANSLSGGKYQAFVMDRDGKVSGTMTTKQGLVKVLIEEIIAYCGEREKEKGKRTR